MGIVAADRRFDYAMPRRGRGGGDRRERRSLGRAADGVVVKDAKSANGLTDTEIKTHLKVFADKGIISKYGIPEKILFVEKLAKTSVGKINKKELREKYGAM